MNETTLSSIIKSALLVAVFLLFINIPLNPNQGLVSSAQASGPSVVTQVLSGQTVTGSVVSGGWVVDLYNYSKAFVNIIALVILFFIAFATILGIQVDTYGVKKLLPATIIAVIVANLSLPIFAIGSSIIDALQNEISYFAPYKALNAFFLLFRKIDWRGIISTMGVGLTLGSIVTGGMAGGLTALMTVLALIVPVLIVLALGLVLSFRPYIIFLAAGVSPIAIMLSVLPQTQSLFKRWLGIAAAWLVMPIVVFGILHLMDDIPTISYIPGSGGAITGIIGVFLPTALKAGLLLLAIRFPFMIEKDVSGLINTIGKFAGKTALYSGARVGRVAYDRFKASDLNQTSKADEQLKKSNFQGGADSSNRGLDRNKYVVLKRSLGMDEDEARKEFDENSINENMRGYHDALKERIARKQYVWNRPEALLNASSIASTSRLTRTA